MVEHSKLRGFWHCDSNLPSERRDAIAARLGSVLLSWQGTPWVQSSNVKGRGADCIGFVSTVIDELYKKKFNIDLPSPVGQSHDACKFLEFYARCRKLWPVQGGATTVDMGDLILDRPKNGHAHLYITGPVPYSLWHCLNGHGVCHSGFDSLGENLTFYRLLNKESWI